MAARYWVGGTGNWDSTTTANWSATSGGAGGVSVPTAADDVFIDANSGAVTVTKTTSTSCLTLIFTGFTGTFTIANGITLTVFGTAITLGSGMTYTQGTTGVLSTQGNQGAITITFAGITIPRLTCGKTTNFTQTVTISGTTPTIQNLVIANSLTTTNVVFSGTAITITSSLSVTGGFFTNSTGQITFSGTCTINCSTSTNTISGGFNVTTGSSLQMLSNIYLAGGTVAFTGTATLNASTFTLFCSTAVTFNTSTVNWYNVTLTQLNIVHILSSALNISNNLTVSITSGTGLAIDVSTFAINISGSLLGSGQLGRWAGTGNINMLGTGTIDIPDINAFTVNINTTNVAGYTIGSSTNPTLIFGGAGSALNLIGTSVAQVYSTSAHTLSVSNTTLTTNNTATGANIVGGSQITWGNISATANTVTLTYNTTALGNLVGGNVVINTGRLYVGGNLSTSGTITGTSIIELNTATSTTWGAGTYQISVTINKAGGTLTLPTAATITWGTVGKILTYTSGTINVSTSTLAVPANNAVTINGMSFYNLTLPGSAIYTINSTISISNDLTLAATGDVTFAGSAGWTCANSLCSTPGRTITFVAGVTYTTTSNTNMLGTAASPITMISSSPAAIRAIWTLNQGATQSMVYVNARAIDSNAGQTIWTFGGNITTALIPLNWNPGTRPGTSAYTFVN
jgi:hypothetical protein